MQFYAKSVTGKVRSNNQDCYHIPLGRENEAKLFVVSDGMGGTRGGEVASTLSTSAFVTFIQSNSEQEDKALLLRRGAARANTEVYRAARADARFKDMGTTMTAALVEGESIYVLQIGDSRAYLLRDYDLKQITTDHSYVQELVEKGYITEEEAAHHPDKNKITRALGTGSFVNADIYTLSWRPGDLLLLCSDGLSNMLSKAEIRKIMCLSQGCEKCAEMLVEKALEAGGRDNITVVCVRFCDSDGISG
ncbi:MAG: Stp1/IreP family PP2C-type Ser/Thr phosphatase [Clostridiales bacterium]|nr:Stp1/IreP family PP2C-type Ser/Thr phosphatase [Clostridiales bacterium]